MVWDMADYLLRPLGLGFSALALGAFADNGQVLALEGLDIIKAVGRITAQPHHHFHPRVVEAGGGAIHAGPQPLGFAGVVEVGTGQVLRPEFDRLAIAAPGRFAAGVHAHATGL
jgi:hypothetical protein